MFDKCKNFSLVCAVQTPGAMGESYGGSRHSITVADQIGGELGGKNLTAGVENPWLHV